jgi:hypothetical protein
LHLRTPSQSCNKTGTAAVNRLPKIMPQTLASEPMKVQDTSLATNSDGPVSCHLIHIGYWRPCRVKNEVGDTGEISRDVYGISCNSYQEESDKFTRMSTSFWYEVHGLPKNLSGRPKSLLEQLR